VAVEDDVAAVAFTAETELGPEAIRAAGRRAAEAARRYLRTTISEVRATASGVRYLAQGPGGFERQMALRLAWEEIGGGRRRVHITVGDYLVERSRVLGIPFGPATVPALGSARRFAEALKTELTAHRPAPVRHTDLTADGRAPLRHAEFDGGSAPAPRSPQEREQARPIGR
jgi:hypothetical protein